MAARVPVKLEGGEERGKSGVEVSGNDLGSEPAFFCSGVFLSK